MRAATMLAIGFIASVAVTAAGCSTYHYYDIDVTFDTGPMGFAGTNEISTIQRCVMNVSGADSGQLVMGLTDNCPPMTAAGIGTHMGVVEFSTFKDSGNLTFTMDVYNAQTIVPGCKVGSGTKTLAASSMTTTMDSLSVLKTGTGCP
jgi:hypothetical protein